MNYSFWNLQGRFSSCKLFLLRSTFLVRNWMPLGPYRKSFFLWYDSSDIAHEFHVSKFFEWTSLSFEPTCHLLKFIFDHFTIFLITIMTITKINPSFDFPNFSCHLLSCWEVLTPACLARPF